MSKISLKVARECKALLLEKKTDLIHRAFQYRADYMARDNGSDEADQSQAILAENSFLNAQNRLRALLLEVEQALARIENGTYGVCEETEELIEANRLLAIPWTRLSIEGAEMKDHLEKKFAR